MKKKRIIIVTAIILALILLFPIPLWYKDGGSIEFRSIVNLYSITRLHEWRPVGEGKEGGYNVGIEIRLFGLKVYRNTRVSVD